MENRNDGDVDGIKRERERKKTETKGYINKWSGSHHIIHNYNDKCAIHTYIDILHWKCLILFKEQARAKAMDTC